MKNNKRDYVFTLSLIIIFAFILRYYKANVLDFWVDDAFSYWMSLQPLSNILNWLYNFDSHPPLFYFFMHLWLKAGENPLTLRLPGIILGTLSLVPLYFLAKEFMNKEAALIAVFLTAVCAMHIRMCQEVRMYPYLSFFVIFGFYFFVKLFDGVQRTAYSVQRPENETRYAVRGTQYGYWLLYVLCTVMSWYLHYFGIFTTIGQNFIVLLFFRRINIKYWIYAQLAVLLCYIPWYKYFFYQLICGRGPAEGKFIWHALIPVWNTFFVPQVLIYPEKFGLLVVYLVFMGTLLIPVLAAVNYRKDRFFLSVAFIGFYLPLAILYLKSLFSARGMFQARYFYYALPVYFIIVTASFFTKEKIKPFLAFLILGAFLTINTLALYNMYYVKGFSIQRWTEATDYMKQFYKTNDAVIVQSGFQAYAFNYYFREKHKEYYMKTNEIWKIKDILKNHERIWLVMSFAGQDDPENKAAKWLFENCVFERAEKFQNFVFNQGDVIVILFSKRK